MSVTTGTASTRHDEKATGPCGHRRILLRPDVTGWTIWQIHGLADIDGIKGPVDLNIARSSP